MNKEELKIIDLLAHKRISDLEDEVNDLKQLVYELKKKSEESDNIIPEENPQEN